MCSRFDILDSSGGDRSTTTALRVKFRYTDEQARQRLGLGEKDGVISSRYLEDAQRWVASNDVGLLAGCDSEVGQSLDVVTWHPAEILWGQGQHLVDYERRRSSDQGEGQIVVLCARTTTSFHLSENHIHHDVRKKRSLGR